LIDQGILGRVTVAFQASLFDVGQEFELVDLSGVARTTLDHGAWLDVLPGWAAGADDLFERLIRVVPWRAERRPMYDRVVDVPRLLSFYGKDEQLPDPALYAAMRALDERYQPELGEPLCTAGLCLYRDGADSVAWHGDTSGRKVRHTIVAILSLGNPRAFLLRPTRAGGRTLRYLVGHGDLLVMGGTCQRTWQHAVPKTTKATGPRISVQFRPAGVH
jgi:alkylated DNA repair dioxygenase AlkB